jgi:hypothetical protein
VADGLRPIPSFRLVSPHGVHVPFINFGSHQQYRYGAIPDRPFGITAEIQAVDPAAAVGSHDDQIRLPFLRLFEDDIGDPRRYGLDDAGFRFDAIGVSCRLDLPDYSLACFTGGVHHTFQIRLAIASDSKREHVDHVQDKQRCRLIPREMNGFASTTV